MQQGMLSSVLLLSALLICVPNVSSTEMLKLDAEQWLSEPQLQHKTTELYQRIIDEDIDGLNFALQRLSLPAQEVVRYLLLKKVEQQKIPLSTRMALFVEQQKLISPTYHIIQRGDGYELSVPAFNYPAIAFRLLKHWQNNKDTLAFILDAEREDLNLKQWLTGDEYELKEREDLLIRELDTLSPNAVNVLVKQITSEVVISWLPSSQVMVRLAQVSQNKEIYRLLWLMRVDFAIESELIRLAKSQKSSALEQVMLAASSNPGLKNLAIKELTRLKPMPAQVKQFLVALMSGSDDARFVANELVRHGYSTWLEELVATNQSIHANIILSVIAQ